MSAEHLLAVTNATIGFAGKPLITELSIDLHPAGRLALTGPSGIGKSTLMEAILNASIGGEKRALQAGSITINALAIGYAAQRPQIPCWFQVGALLQRLICRAAPDRREHLTELCTRFGLDGLSNAHLRILSGGELQRLNLVAALCLAHDLLVLDEPLTALDLPTKLAMLSVVVAFLERHKIGLLVVSHDIDILLGLAPTVCVLGSRGVVATIDDHMPDCPSRFLSKREALLDALKSRVTTIGAFGQRL